MTKSKFEAFVPLYGAARRDAPVPIRPGEERGEKSIDNSLSLTSVIHKVFRRKRHLHDYGRLLHALVRRRDFRRMSRETNAGSREVVLRPPKMSFLFLESNKIKSYVERNTTDMKSEERIMLKTGTTLLRLRITLSFHFNDNKNAWTKGSCRKVVVV